MTWGWVSPEVADRVIRRKAWLRRRAAIHLVGGKCDGNTNVCYGNYNLNGIGGPGQRALGREIRDAVVIDILTKRVRDDERDANPKAGGPVR